MLQFLRVEFNLIRADTVVNSDHEDSDAGENVVMQSARADVDDERGDVEENVSAVADDGEHIFFTFNTRQTQFRSG